MKTYKFNGKLKNNYSQRNLSMLERFTEKYKVNTETGCWEWQSFFLKDGYGGFWNNGRSMGAHRVSVSLFRGEVPKGMFVCHHCDNRKCVNPDHLFIGTPLDNNKDMIKKGRQNPPVGERAGSSKLKNADVIKIREMHSNGSTQREIAKVFGVGYKAISKIVNRQRWRHI